MWPSQPQQITGDSLTTVMVLAQKLKLHNPVLTAAPGLHEEMCLQITRRNNRTFNSSNEDNVDCNRQDNGNTSTSASSTLSSVYDANDEKTGSNPFLQKRPPVPKTLQCVSQKLNASTSGEMKKQYKMNQTAAGSCNQKHQSAMVLNSVQKNKTPLRTSERQRRPLLSQAAVDIDTENDTDAETSNGTEIISMSDEELRNFAIQTMSNSDYDDAFESVSVSSAKEDNNKCFGQLNVKSRLTNRCDSKQEIIRTCTSLSPATKPCKENVSGAKVKVKPAMTPPKLSSPSMPFRHPNSNTKDLESEFCRFSPLRQKTGKNEADGDKQNPKNNARIFGKIQASDRQDDGLGASLDDNEDDEDVQPGNAACKPTNMNAPVLRRKRNDVKKGRTVLGRRQGDGNGSDTSNTSSSSSLCYSPYTTFSPADTSSPLSESVANGKHGRNSDLAKELMIGHNNGGCSVNGNTDFGQKLNLLQSELRNKVKNRRYNALMHMMSVGYEYFSEEAMKSRDPLLYEEMIGQYLTKEERTLKAADIMGEDEFALSNFLMKHVEQIQENNLYYNLKDREVQLRHHDENLARQFLQIYRDIQILKVQRACLDHQDLLDDAIDEVEDRDRLLDLCDTPKLKHSGSKLRHCGLTKMNICSRRFSCS